MKSGEGFRAGRISEEDAEKRIAYEVSVSKLELSEE